MEGGRREASSTERREVCPARGGGGARPRCDACALGPERPQNGTTASGTSTGEGGDAGDKSLPCGAAGGQFTDLGRTNLMD